MTPHERLAEWIRTSAKSQTALAADLGCSANHLSRIANGHAKPARRLANAIARETGAWREGPITAADWDEADEGAAA